MNEIRLGLSSKVNVSLYANSEFDWGQMNEIRDGLEDDLDVSLYANLKFSKYQMREIRLKLLKKSTLK